MGIWWQSIWHACYQVYGKRGDKVGGKGMLRNDRWLLFEFHHSQASPLRIKQLIVT